MMGELPASRNQLEGGEDDGGIAKTRIPAGQAKALVQLSERHEVPTTGARPTVPHPEVPVKRSRRGFSAEYKLRILEGADAARPERGILIDGRKGTSRGGRGLRKRDTYIEADLRFPGDRVRPGLVREPEGNGLAERFSRTLEEQLPWLRAFNSTEEVGVAERGAAHHLSRWGLNGDRSGGFDQGHQGVAHGFQMLHCQYRAGDVPYQEGESRHRDRRVTLRGLSENQLQKESDCGFRSENRGGQGGAGRCFSCAASRRANTDSLASSGLAAGGVDPGGNSLPRGQQRRRTGPLAPLRREAPWLGRSGFTGSAWC